MEITIKYGSLTIVEKVPRAVHQNKSLQSLKIEILLLGDMEYHK